MCTTLLPMSVIQPNAIFVTSKEVLLCNVICKDALRVSQ